MKENFDIFLIVMALLAAVVYAALHFFEAGYGYLFDRRYGPPVPNRVGWMVMESPVFILMCVLWASSERMWQAGPLALFCLFQAHYLQRAFIFPLLIRGKGRMPLGIVVMGMVFNTLNALMQGGWIFYVSPADYYAGWFAQPYIYIGGALFVAGMASTSIRTTSSATSAARATRATTSPAGACSATSRRPTTSANCSNGWDSP